MEGIITDSETGEGLVGVNIILDGTAFGSIDLSAVTVEAHQPFSAASSKAIRNFDLRIKPVRSARMFQVWFRVS